MDQQILPHIGSIVTVLALEFLQVVMNHLDVPLQGTCRSEGLLTLITWHSIDVQNLR